MKSIDSCTVQVHMLNGVSIIIISALIIVILSRRSQRGYYGSIHTACGHKKVTPLPWHGLKLIGSF